MGSKLGGANLSDDCYVELFLRGLINKEVGELIKAEVLRQSKDPYHVDMRVLVDYEGDLYRATIIARHHDFMQNMQVTVEYDASDGFDENTEQAVAADRLTPDNNVNTHAKAMETVRASNWTTMCERVNNDIGPQPFYNPRPKRDKRKLYTYQQALLLAQSQPTHNKRRRLSKDKRAKQETEKKAREERR